MTKKQSFSKNLLYVFLILLSFSIWITDYLRISNSSKILLTFFTKLICTIILLSLIYKIIKKNKIIGEKDNAIDNLNVLDTDSGLFNLKHFYVQLEKEVYRAERQKYSLSLGIIELNQNKEISKYIGEIVETEILKDIGNLIIENTRKNVDMAFRYNENIFAIILIDLDTSHAKIVAERIMKKFLGLKENTTKYSNCILTMGFIQYRSGWDMKTYNQRAYRTMQEAKQNGDNQTIVI